MALPDLSIQLYSVREPMMSDVPGTLARLAGIGLTRVEPWNFVQTAPELKAALASAGMTAPTAHQHLVGVDDLGEVVRTAADLGIETVVEPMVAPERWATREGILAIADHLAKASAVAAERGLRVGYHNHAFEFQTVIDGRTAYEVFVDLLDPAVVLELDTYWAAVGGQDVPALLERLGPRVVAIHLKDGPLAGTTADQVPLGRGDLPVRQIVEAASAVEYPVLEFDDYAGDIFAAIAASYSYATTTLGARR